MSEAMDTAVEASAIVAVTALGLAGTADPTLAVGTVAGIAGYRRRVRGGGARA